MSVLTSIRPTVRRRIGRVTTYVVAFLVIVLLASIADWDAFGKMFFNLDVAQQMWPSIVTVALKNTVIYTFAGFIGGAFFGTILALLKLGGGPFGWFASVYIEFFRGIPMLLTIYAMAFMIPIAFGGAKLPGGTVGAGVIGLIIVTSAYMAETIRSGIQAVPRGQREAARSLGMSNTRAMISVVLPQGFRIVIPPLTNEFVLLLKDTSLMFIAGLSVTEKELTTFARDAVSTHFNGTPLVMAAVAYLVITIPMTYLVGRLEKRLDPKR